MLKNIKISFYVFLFTLYFSIYAASSQSYLYDTNGNLTQTINANGIPIAYEYDNFNRLISKNYQNGKKMQYEYDSIGRRIAVKEGNKVISYEYDIFGNISKVTFPNSQSVQYLYDPLGNLLKLTYPDDSSIVYSYDNSNRLISIKDFSGITKYEYNEKLNALKKKILPNGTSTEFIYNAARKISNVIHKNKDQKLIKEYQYEYDLDGNRIKIEEIDQNTRSNVVYIYDKLNRLVSAKYSNGFSESYTYDQIGNRLTKTTPQGKINYEYDLESRLIKANDTKFYYDNAGNLIKKISSKNSAEYVYDADNLLISYVDNDNEVVFEYDAEGNRTAKIVNGYRTEYVNDLVSPVSQVLVKYVQKSFLRKGKAIKYIYGRSRISQSCNGETQYYLYDSLEKDVCFLINSLGESLGDYEYDSFGNGFFKNKNIKNIYKYCGEQCDEETRLIYLRNRYYDPEIGRFISKDKNLGDLDYPKSLNPYTYAENNPINLIDPLGNKAITLEKWELVKIHNNFRCGYLGGQGIAGHDWIELPDRIVDNKPLSKGNYPDGIHEDDFKNVKACTYTIGFYWPSSKVDKGIDKMVSIDYSLLHNCVYTVVEGLKAMEAPGANEIVFPFGISSPQVFKPQEQKLLKNYPDTYFQIDNSKPLNLPTSFYKESQSYLNLNESPSLDYGGISLSKKAELQLNILDIAGAAFDQNSGQIILFGKENHYLPKVNMDDLAVAVKSIYGIGLERPQDPGISIDPLPKNAKNTNMKVRYDGATENTNFGLTMFEADRLLKCLAVGRDNITKKSLTANIPGFKNIFDRMKDEIIGEFQARLWFVPEQITLVEGENTKGFVFDEVKMQVLTEAQKFKYNKDTTHCIEFAKYFTEHYDEFAKQFPIFEKLKDLGKITAIIKWIKDNNIFFDTSYFVNYKPKFYKTPEYTPATVNGDIRNGRSIIMVGGVVYSLNQNNFNIEKHFSADNLISSVIDSRPSDNDFSWSFQSPINRDTFSAVVQSIYRTKKPGNIKKQFCDLYLSKGNINLQLNRSYNSFSEHSSFFGYGWNLMPYEIKFTLEKVSITNNEGKNINTFKTILVKILGKEDFFIIRGLTQDGHPFFTNQNGSYFIIENLQGNFLLYSMNSELIAEFNKKGYLTKTIEDDFTITYEYDQNHLVKTCHEKGFFISFKYQNDKIVKAIGNNGMEVSYSYDLQGLLNKTTDVYGLNTYYFYDKDKRLNRITDNEQNVVFYAIYDDYNRAIEVQDGQLKYCSEFSLKEKQMKIVDQAGYEIIYQYDEKDRLIQKQQKDKKINFFYDQDCLLPSKIIDEQGKTTLCKYNNRGQITYLKNSIGAEWQLFYDERGNLVLEQQPVGRWKYYMYDDKNRLIRVDLKVDEVRFAENKDSFSITSDGLYTFFLDYNNQNKKPQSIRTITGSKTVLKYDEYGNLIQAKMPTGYTKNRIFDENNRVTQISDDFGVEALYEYNLFDQIVKITKANGSETFEYNKEGVLTKIIDLNGNATNYEYDEQHNLIRVIDCENSIYNYEYGSNNKIISISYPNGTYKTFEYDIEGNLALEIDGK